MGLAEPELLMDIRFDHDFRWTLGFAIGCAVVLARIFARKCCFNLVVELEVPTCIMVSLRTLLFATKYQIRLGTDSDNFTKIVPDQIWKNNSITNVGLDLVTTFCLNYMLF